MTEAATQEQQTITIENKQYPVAELSPKVQQLIGIFQRWQAELVEKRLEVAKVEAATRDISREIIETVKADEAAKVAAPPVNDPIVIQ